MATCQKVPAGGTFCSKECRQKKRLMRCGVPCVQCGEVFVRNKPAQAVCSSECLTQKRKDEGGVEVTCEWCGTTRRTTRQKATRNAATYCSHKCDKARKSFKSWMRKKQQEYRKAIDPNPHQVVTKNTWEGFCLYTSQQTHEHKERTLEQMWRAKTTSAARCNRHRISVVSHVRTQNGESTWDSLCKKAAKPPKDVSRYQQWAKKIHNTMSSQQQRLQRKLAASQARNCMND